MDITCYISAGESHLEGNGLGVKVPGGRSTQSRLVRVNLELEITGGLGKRFVKSVYCF